ncbi:ACT domain-containing protein [Euzebya sp.]|uniref:ACT domain-containing protein n=1 Tax=Euzebya sp. TaxID=1971409 RepID=UPI003514D877
MHKDFTLIPDDQPGVLARLGEACGRADISIEGLSAFTGQGKGVVHVLVPDAEHALEVLAEAGLDVRAARDVVVVEIADQPGAMGEICRSVADAGINIEQAYLATGGRMVMVVDDVDRARELLGVP